MVLKEAFKPRWWKFILPLIFFILLLGLFVVTKKAESVIGEATCMAADIHQEVMELRDQNASEEVFNQKINELESTLRQVEGLDESYLIIELNYILSKFEPLYPVPCILKKTTFCTYYEPNPVYYECMNEFLAKSWGIVNMFDAPTFKKEDIRFNYFWWLFNILLILIVAYLIPCIVELLIRGWHYKIKIEKNQTTSPTK